MTRYHLNRSPLTLESLANKLLRPLSLDFSEMLSENIATYTSSVHIPTSNSAKAGLARFILEITLNTMRNRDIRRTYNLLTKGLGSQVRRFMGSNFLEEQGFRMSVKEREYLELRLDSGDNFEESLMKWLWYCALFWTKILIFITIII